MDHAVKWPNVRDYQAYMQSTVRPSVHQLLAGKLYYFAAAIEGLGPKDFKLIANVCKSWNVVCDAYLLACHMYYSKDDPLMSDGAFDALVHYIMYHQQEVRKHAVNGHVLPEPFGPSSSHAILIPSDILAFAKAFQ